MNTILSLENSRLIILKWVVVHGAVVSDLLAKKLGTIIHISDDGDVLDAGRGSWLTIKEQVSIAAWLDILCNQQQFFAFG